MSCFFVTMLQQEIVQVRVNVCVHIDIKSQVFTDQRNVAFEGKSGKTYANDGKEVKLKRSVGELPVNNRFASFQNMHCFDPFSCKHTMK